MRGEKDLYRDSSKAGASVSSWASPSASLCPGLASLAFRTNVCLGEHRGASGEKSTHLGSHPSPVAF